MMSRHFLISYSFEAALKIVVNLSIEGLTDRMLVEIGTGLKEEGLDRQWGDSTVVGPGHGREWRGITKIPRDKRDQCNGPFPHPA